MANDTVLTQATLDALATYAANNLFSHLTVGTGDDPIDLTSTDLETPVQIGSSDRNKAFETITVTDNFFVLSVKLTATEPDTQPVNLSQAGIQPGTTTTDDLRAGLNYTADTKDNQSQWTLRFTGKIIQGT